MEQAWCEHVRQLTLAQLSSAEECQAHINEFELQLVSTALGHTVIGSVYDIGENIASMLRCHPHPDAQSMKRLSNISQRTYNMGIVNEMLAHAKRRSEQGYFSTLNMTFRKLNGYKPFMVEVPACGIEAIIKILEEHGYTVSEGVHGHGTTMQDYYGATDSAGLLQPTKQHKDYFIALAWSA